MITAKPEYLYLLLLVLPVTGIAVYSYYTGKKDLQKLGGDWRYNRLVNVYIVKSFFIHIFFTLFLICGVLALADIKWDNRYTEDDRDGYELVIAMDISRSMLADDIRPDRFRAMVRQVKWLINELPGAQFSIVIYKGKASKIIPVTEDSYALSLFLNGVSPDLITVPGSDMEDAINTALKAFTITGKYRAIILFSDGENLSGNPLAAARAAGASGIPVITVCIGTEAGQNIPLGPGNYLRNKEGKMVLSKANPQLLADIARQSRGKAYRLTNFYMIKNELTSIAKQTRDDNVDPGLKLEKVDKFQLFLSLSLVFLTLSILTRGIRWKKIA